MQPIFLNEFAHDLSGYCSLWVHVYYWVWALGMQQWDLIALFVNYLNQNHSSILIGNLIPILLILCFDFDNKICFNLPCGKSSKSISMFYLLYSLRKLWDLQTKNINCSKIVRTMLFRYGCSCLSGIFFNCLSIYLFILHGTFAI